MLRQEEQLLRAPVTGLNELRGIARASRTRWRAVFTICVLLLLTNVMIGFVFEPQEVTPGSGVVTQGVVLVTLQTDTGIRIGTGFAVTDSTILTAAHVVGDTGTIVELSNDSGFVGEGRVVASGYPQYKDYELGGGMAQDEGTPYDWALVQYTSSTGKLEPLACGSVFTVEQGYDVFLIGHPQGQLTTSKGIVSRKTDEVVYTDGALDPGFSGGPMIWLPNPDDPKMGYVIGINVAVPIDAETSQQLTSSRKAVSIDHVITQCANAGFGICDAGV